MRHSEDRAPAPVSWRGIEAVPGAGWAGVRGAPLSDGVGCEAPGGVHNAEGTHLHAARRQDMLEEAAPTLTDVEAGGAWTGTAWFAVGEGDDAILQADDAPGGDGPCEDRGCQGWEGGGAIGIGLAVDVPWGGPDVWIDLCTRSGRAHLLCEERAGDRCQGAHGDREVGSGRPPGLPVLRASATRDDGVEVGRIGQWAAPGRQDTRKAGQSRADAARLFGQAFERLGSGRDQALGG